MSEAEVYRITSSSKLSKAITLLKHEILLKFRFALVYTVWQTGLHHASDSFTLHGKLVYTVLQISLHPISNNYTPAPRFIYTAYHLTQHP